ncbi:unnamed protein product [Sphagnum jensenii]|uniref:HMA domain-containing protein n=1 Tax=Sphagnum jensenii TaxID=128206 RepID=A0ABP0X7H6_9BRYO
MALQLASSVGQQRMVQSSSEDDRRETLLLLQSTWPDWDGNGVVDEVRFRVLVNWEEEEEEEETRNQKLLVSVRGMTCAACSTSVEMALERLPAVMTAAVTLTQENAEILDCLRRLPGIARASVTLTAEIGEVESDPRLIDQQAIISTTDDTGFDAALVDSPQRAKISFLVKGMNNYEDRKSIEEWRTVELTATKWCCPTPTHEFHLIMVQRLGTCISCSCGVVLSVAVTGSPAMTYFETSAMLFSFVLLGKYRESLMKGKTSEAIVKLLELAPTTAILLTVDSSIVLITYMLFLIMKATHLLYSN